MVNLTRLEKLMNDKGWGVGELATYSGLKYDTIYSMKVGRRKNPGAATLQKVAAALGTTVDYLLGKDGVDAQTGPPVPPMIRRLADIAGRMSELKQEELLRIAETLAKLDREQVQNPLPTGTMPILLEIVQKFREQGGKDEDILPWLEALMRPSADDGPTSDLGENVADEPLQDE